MLDVRLNTPLTVDPKGRITLPVRLKAQLDHVGTNVLVFIVQRDHLRAYTKADFAKNVEAPLLAQDSFDPEVERKQRLRLGFAIEVEVDRQARVLLPANLRGLAGIERDAVLISLADRLELWDQARLDAWMNAELARGAASA
jgi:MraZ protein